MPLSGISLKNGFQLLRIQNTVDGIVVDEKTNASVFEHLVYKYDLFAHHYTFMHIQFTAFCGLLIF